MVRSIGAQVGLLAFAIALLAGISVGNSATVILIRAITAMIAGAIVGQIAGWAAKAVLRDHLQRQKLAIDRAHLAAIRAQTGETDEAAEEAPLSEREGG